MYHQVSQPTLVACGWLLLAISLPACGDDTGGGGAGGSGGGATSAGSDAASTADASSGDTSGATTDAASSGGANCLATGDPCGDCVAESCCEESAACGAGSACFQASLCVAQCDGITADCFPQCAINGDPAWDAYSACMVGNCSMATRICWEGLLGVTRASRGHRRANHSTIGSAPAFSSHGPPAPMPCFASNLRR